MLTNNVFLMQLLPQSPQAIIAHNKQALNLLTLYQHFVEQTLGVFEHTFKEEWWAFDPQVGENQCQIRAYQILLLSEELNRSKEMLIKQYEEVKKLYIDLIVIKNQFTNEKINYFSSKITLEALLIKNNLTCSINESIYYLTQCRFLTLFGEKDHNEMYVNINYNKLCSTLSLSKTIARKMVHQFQVYLSTVSCSFIFSLFNRRNGLTRFKEIIDLLYHHDEDGRAVFSLYFTTIAIMRDFMQRSGFIIIDVKDNQSNNKKYCFYIDRNKLNLKTAPTSEKDKICLVLKSKTQINLVEAETVFLNTFMNDFKLIILANEASHPQYPGNLLGNRKTNPFNEIATNNKKIRETIRHLNSYFTKIQEKADLLGCSKFNPDLFFIEHIFCSTLQKEMNLVYERIL